MAFTVAGLYVSPPKTHAFGEIDTRDYREWYPRTSEGKMLNFKPGSKLHDFIKVRILDRANDAMRSMTSRHPYWAEIDRMVSAYISLNELEMRIKAKDPRVPVSIVVPECYATLETMLTYLLAAFGEDPIFRCNGVGPEDVLGSILLEKLIEMQTRRSKALLSLHTQWRDSLCYGFGAVSVAWQVRRGMRTQVQPIGYNDIDGQMVPTGYVKNLVPATLFEGSVISPIDNYKYLVDPGSDITNPQTAEYVGWVSRASYTKLLRDENAEGSIHFNVEYLKDMAGISNIYMSDDSGRNERITDSDRSRPKTEPTHPIDVIYMYVDLIPKEWKLGQGETPEKWMFALAADEIIIAAAPLDLMHQMFPVAVCAPDFGGHEIAPLAKLETAFGLQECMNFLFNSHIKEVRRGLSNRIIYDPKLVRQDDVESGNFWIRLRKHIWGRGIRDVAEQLPVTDVTRTNFPDMMITRDMIRNITGAVDSLQGLQRTHGERVTKAEFMETRSSALSRLQKAARIISMQSMYDIAMLYAYHTQQFMTESTYVSTVGRTEQTLREEYGIADPFILTTPFDINVPFDVWISDGSIEGGEYADAWVQLWGAMNSSPELLERIDTVRVFLHIARLLKARNASDFLRKTPQQAQVVPDQEALQGAEAGNLVRV